MGTGYTRNDTSNNIADGNVIDAADLDGEFDSIQAAFNASTGHTHDGTSAEGAPITVTGPAQEYVSTGTELRGKTTNTYDLGSSSVQWKDLYVDGTGYIDTLSADAATVNGNITVTGTVDGRDVAADGTKLDGIESGATADQTAAEIRALVEAATDSNVFTDADHTKLNGIEAGADVTDAANVTAAGALMDSEITDITAIKTLNQQVGTTAQPTFGGLTLTGNLNLSDSDIIYLGAGQDLRIYHDGSDSFINETGTGDLKIQAAAQIKLGSPTNEFYATFNENSSVVLYYDNAAKLATATGGVSVTGNIAVTGTVDGRDVATDGSKLDGIEAGADVTDTTNVTAAGALMDSELTNITAVKALNQGVSTGDSPTFAGGTFTSNVSFGDSDILQLGNANDLQLVHNGSHSYIIDQGAGNLYIQGSNGIYFQNQGGTENYIGCNLNGDVDLYYDNSVKLSTTSTGINVTGTITADGLDMEDNQKILLGAGDDLQIYHDGSNSYITDVGSGDLYIKGSNNVQIEGANGENMAVFNENGAVNLYHNNALKFSTASYGVSVTGSAVASTLTGNVSGSVTLGYDSYQNFVLTMTGNVTLANPTTEKVGQSGFIVLIHSGAARTVSLGTDYETAGGAGLTLSATAGATDIVPYIVAASGRILLGTPQLAFS